MLFHGQPIASLSNQALIQARDELVAMANKAIVRKAQYREGGIKVKPPDVINTHFSALQVAIVKEIKDRGI